MSSITQSPDMTQLQPPDLQRLLTIFLKNVVQTVNGNLDFGNFNAQLLTASFPNANTQVAVPHSLGRAPTGRIVYSQNMNGIIYDGTTPWTSAVIYLQSSASGKASLIIF